MIYLWSHSTYNKYPYRNVQPEQPTRLAPKYIFRHNVIRSTVFRPIDRILSTHSDTRRKKKTLAGGGNEREREMASRREAKTRNAAPNDRLLFRKRKDSGANGAEAKPFRECGGLVGLRVL